MGQSVGSGGRARELRRLMQLLALRVRVEVSEPDGAALSARELSVLARLVLGGPTGVKTLVAETSMPASSMSSLLDRLESRGLVQRQRSAPDDRRLVVVGATPAATAAFDGLAGGLDPLARWLAESLPERDQEELVELLRRHT